MLLALTALLIGITGGFAVARPAHAAMSDCPAARLCTWTNANYTGVRWEWSIGTITTLPNQCLNVTASANNNASSMWANAGIIGTRVTLHEGANCTGLTFQISTNQSDSNFSTGNPIFAFDNSMSSIGART